MWLIKHVFHAPGFLYEYLLLLTGNSWILVHCRVYFILFLTHGGQESHNCPVVILMSGLYVSILEQVRPYPRRAFEDGESALTLNELGLTSKQEALYLESI